MDVMDEALPKINDSKRVPTTVWAYARYAVMGIAAIWILLVGVLVLGRLAGFSTVTVLSQSMVPVANVEDLLITRSFDGTPTINDIYVFDSPTDGHQTAHRIVSAGSDGDHWITKGDANTTQDMQQITTSAVSSHVVAVIPRFLNVLPFLDSLLGRMLALALPFLLLLVPLSNRRSETAEIQPTSPVYTSHALRRRMAMATLGLALLSLVGLRTLLGLVISVVPTTADPQAVPSNAIVLLQPKIAQSIQPGEVIRVQMPNAQVQTLERVTGRSLKKENGQNLLLLNIQQGENTTNVAQVQTAPTQNVYASFAVIPNIGGVFPGIGTPAGFAAIVGLAGTAGTLLLMYSISARPRKKFPR